MGKQRAVEAYELVYASATLAAALGRMSLEDRESALEGFDSWRATCEKIAKKLDPLSFAHSYHVALDERVDRMLATSPHAKSMACRKGCAACCHVYVGIFPHEARLLRAAAAEAGVEIDEERLAKQAQKTEDTWLELSPEDRRCVFLGEDRTCRVYEYRPGGCRKYLVNSDPELCDADKYRNGDVTVLFSVDAEIMHSAAMTTFLPNLRPGCDSMAVVLLGVKDEKQ